MILNNEAPDGDSNTSKPKDSNTNPKAEFEDLSTYSLDEPYETTSMRCDSDDWTIPSDQEND